MTASIRDYEPSDEELIVGLSLRAWEPVLAAVAEMLGPELFARLRGDWGAGQAAEVRGVLADHAQRVWVAEAGGEPIGALEPSSRSRRSPPVTGARRRPSAGRRTG